MGRFALALGIWSALLCAGCEPETVGAMPVSSRGDATATGPTSASTSGAPRAGAFAGVPEATPQTGTERAPESSAGPANAQDMRAAALPGTPGKMPAASTGAPAASGGNTPAASSGSGAAAAAGASGAAASGPCGMLAQCCEAITDRSDRRTCDRLVQDKNDNDCMRRMDRYCGMR